MLNYLFFRYQVNHCVIDSSVYTDRSKYKITKQLSRPKTMGSISKKPEQRILSKLSWFDDDEKLFSSLRETGIISSKFGNRFLTSNVITTKPLNKKRKKMLFEQSLPKLEKTNTQIYNKRFVTEKAKPFESKFLGQPFQLNFEIKSNSSNSSSNNSNISWVSAIGTERVSRIFPKQKSKLKQDFNLTLHQVDQNSVLLESQKAIPSAFVSLNKEKFNPKFKKKYQEDYLFKTNCCFKKSTKKVNNGIEHRNNKNNEEFIDITLRPETKDNSSVGDVCFTPCRKKEDHLIARGKKMPLPKLHKSFMFSSAFSQAQDHEDSEDQKKGSWMMRNLSMRSLSRDCNKREPENFSKGVMISTFFDNDTHEPHSMSQYFSNIELKQGSKEDNKSIANIHKKGKTTQSGNFSEYQYKSNESTQKNRKLCRSKTTTEKYNKYQETKLREKSIKPETTYFQSETRDRSSLEYLHDCDQNRDTLLFIKSYSSGANPERRDIGYWSKEQEKVAPEPTQKTCEKKLKKAFQLY